jgi:hypothetical protein
MSAQDYLKAPRLPKTSPVVVLHLRADNDHDGNPRRAFAVLNTAGRTVEVIDEGYGGEAQIPRRWPWYSHTLARRLGIQTAYAIPVYVTPSEYKRWLRHGEDLDTTSSDVVKLRELGRRVARFAAVRDALTEIHRSAANHELRERVAAQDGRENLYGDTSPAVIYHRPLSAHGDDASDHLRRALVALAKAGMIERVSGDHAHGQYRSTDTTPDLY